MTNEPIKSDCKYFSSWQLGFLNKNIYNLKALFLFREIKSINLSLETINLAFNQVNQYR
tara:strand:+ start:10396 stop:10572 length:177 start_codon:yes stop_codon:yes gene_type:complete